MDYGSRMKWLYVLLAILGGLTPGLYLFSRFRSNSLLGDVDLLLLSMGLGLLGSPLFLGVGLGVARMVDLGLGYLRKSR